jgi:hypothetical protein
VERSGGFGGLPTLNEIDTKDLPSKLVNVAKEIMLAKKSSTLSITKTPKGSGDYYSYKISIQDASNRRSIECNEFNIQDDLKLLIKYIERNSKKAG